MISFLLIGIESPSLMMSKWPETVDTFHDKFHDIQNTKVLLKCSNFKFSVDYGDLLYMNASSSSYILPMFF